MGLPHPGVDLGLAVAVQPSGRIVVAGDYFGASGYAVMRIIPGDDTTTGTALLDDSFGSHGVADVAGTTPAGNSTDIAATHDGHILLLDQAPSSSTTGAVDGTLVRLTSTGSVDESFGSAVGARIAVAGANVSPRALVQLPQGDVAVAGTTGAGGAFVAEFRGDGRPDRAMGTGGVRILRSADDLVAATALADGRIIAAGNFRASNVAYRLRGDLKPPSCGGKKATIVGTRAADRLVGTKHADVIAGLRGGDTITGLGKGDIICGGRGNDDIRGGPGADHLYGGPGHDTLRGGPGHDVIKQ
jgi:Ca2+-binding RTX toxin-like protein